MNILFITSSRIGDAVLSTGLLAYIEDHYPDAAVTIACGPLAVSLFEGYPLLDRIIAIKKERYNGHWIKLWRAVVGTRWDMVIDLRNSAVSRLVWARRRYIFGPHINKNFHKAVQNAAVMGLGDFPAPTLWFTDAQAAKAAAVIPDGAPVLGIGPTANWIGKTWPADRFVEIMHYILAESMPDARVAVFGAPGEEADALKVLNAVPEGRGVDCIAKGTPGEAAAMIARCDFYIGNDSGLMHCAAASGVKTLGLFGPSYDHIYAPYGQDFIRTPESFDALIDFDGYDAKTLDHSLMTSLSVAAVKAKLDKVFNAKRS
ncbi:MAG: glycosyltransferase family 9 protein [Bdellovibrionales bacterium]